MSETDGDDPSRVFKGPGFVEVYVPPRPPERPGDDELDFPPGDPPVVRYKGVAANYWRVLEEGQMPYMGGAKVFAPEVMTWLRAIEAQVEDKLMA